MILYGHRRFVVVLLLRLFLASSVDLCCRCILLLRPALLFLALLVLLAVVLALAVLFRCLRHRAGHQ